MSETKIRAAAIGCEQVLNAWDAINDGNPFFAVFYNANHKWFQFNKNDIDAARTFLETNLTVVSETGDNSLYYLNVYDTPQTNYPNKGMIGSIPFRLNDYNAANSGNGVGSIGGVSDFTKAIQDAHNKQIEMIKKIAELEAANQPFSWQDMIGGFIETPGAAQTLVPLLQPVVAGLMGIIHKISGVQPAPYQPAVTPAIAGPESAQSHEEITELLDVQLDRLEKHGNLLEMITSLADFAEKNPTQFKMYFNMLKGQSNG